MHTRNCRWQCRQLLLACVAGVQRGGRGEVECEREARREREVRSLGARRELLALQTKVSSAEAPDVRVRLF